MPALSLYLVTAAVVLLAWRRVTSVTRFAAVVIVLLPTAITGRALVLNRAFGGFDLVFLSAPFSDYAHDFGIDKPHNGILVDQVLQMAPWRHEVRRAIANGEWPLWNSSMLSGDILASSMQAAPYNPVNWVSLLTSEHAATAFDASLYLFLAALFTYSFALALGLAESSALVAAAGYSLSSGIMFFIGWPHGRAWCVLPLVLLAVRRVVRDRDLRSFVLLTIAFVFLIVIGHPETMLHVVAIGAVWGVFELCSGGLQPAWVGVRNVAARRAEARHYTGIVLIALASGATALLLTAISLLPFLEALPLTFDYWMRQAAVLHGPEAAPPHAVAKAMHATFVPYAGGASWYAMTGDWDPGVARVGSVILALAVVAAIRFWRTREVRFFLILGILAMLVGWQWPPLAMPLQRLPLFNMALNDRLGIAAAFSFAMMAGFAVERVDRRIVVAVAVALAIATFAWHAHDPKLLVAGVASETLGIAVLLPPRRAAALLVIAIAAQRLIEDGNSYPAVPREAFYPRTPLIAAVPHDPMARVTATGTAMVPNVSSMFDLDDIRGYASMTYYPYYQTMPLWCPDAKRVWHDINDLTRPFISFLGVRYAFTPRSAEPPPGWHVVRDDRETRLIVNDHALPRVFAPKHIRFIDDQDAALSEMAAASDFSDAAWVYTHDVAPHTIDNGAASLSTRRIGSRFEIDVDALSATYLIISETAWPGWRSYIDGRRVKVDVANRAFLSVYVPQGRHHVRVVYLPESFVRGRAISFATLLLVLLLCGGRRLAGRAAKLR